KISSANRQSAWAILEMDLCNSERSSGVFMRGIRTPRQNLSEKGGTRCLQRVGNSIGLRDSRSSSEKPIHLARRRFLELEDRYETAHLARDTAKFGKPFGRWGESPALEEVLRQVLEADLLSRSPIRSH